MRKVLFISNHAGFSKFNRPYFNHLSSSGWEVHNASPGIEVGDVDYQHNVDIRRSPFSFKNVLALFSLVTLVRTNRFELIHCHTPVGGMLGRLLKVFFPKVRVIYTAHGFHFYRGAPFLFWVLYFPVEYLLSFLTDHLVVINEEDFALSRRFLHARNCTKINGVGVDLSRFTYSEEQRNSARHELSLSVGDFAFIYVAQYVDRKQHALLIDAFSKLYALYPNVRLVLVGDGALRDRIKMRIQDHGLDQVILELGYRRDVEQIYMGADALVSASKQEGFGINLVEGLACGLPILASFVRGHRDILSLLSSNHLSFQATSVDDLFDKMNIIYSDRERNYGMRKEYSAEAKSFDVHSSVAQMALVYRATAGDG